MKAFVAQHQADDINRLLLSANRYPDIDMREAVEQISARCQIKNKLPEWFANSDVVMSGRIPAEQCSSEQTARYKRNLVVGETLCDLTGGMGVDFYYMSQGLKKAVYTERQNHLVECITHNMEALYGTSSHPEFEFRLGDGRELPLPDVDTLYLDPARRANDGSRVYDIAECEPNVVVWQNELRTHCRKLIVKLSPMADISRTLKQLRGVTDLHVVATRNECKEILVEMIGGLEPTDSSLGEAIDNVRIHCVDFRSNDTVSYDYDFGTEQKATVQIVDGCDSCKFLYEPDVTLLKAGVFKLLCADFDVKKVDVNSHYYVSETWVDGFPGRSFVVDDVLPFSGKLLKQLKRKVPRANVSARNFPLTVDQIKERSGIGDGGSVYLFATTIKQLGAVLFRCHKTLVLMLLVLLTLLPLEAWAAKRGKTKTVETSIVTLLDVATERSPFFWTQGRSFVYLGDRLSPMLQPETPLSAVDTTGLHGGVWKFDAIVSEEDWMGQQKMQLRFVSPWGRKFRFGTEQVLTQQIDTAFHPVLGFLQPLDMVHKVDSVLRARTLFILINDDRIIGCDEKTLQKFVPVMIDSVTVGTELAPLRVWFSEDDVHASFFTSLPESREKNTSTTIDRFLSVSDPYLLHSNITKAVWRLIQQSRIQEGMTTEEVRLAMGRPLRFERFNAKSGAVERWYYANGRILEFWDGRFVRMSRE